MTKIQVSIRKKIVINPPGDVLPLIANANWCQINQISCFYREPNWRACTCDVSPFHGTRRTWEVDVSIKYGEIQQSHNRLAQHNSFSLCTDVLWFCFACICFFYLYFVSFNNWARLCSCPMVSKSNFIDLHRFVSVNSNRSAKA